MVEHEFVEEVKQVATKTEGDGKEQPSKLVNEAFYLSGNFTMNLVEHEFQADWTQEAYK